MKDPKVTALPPPEPSYWLRRAGTDATGTVTDAKVQVTVDGETVAVRLGDSAAAAVLLSGHTPYRRTVIDSAPRAPLCMIGACFECLVEIDGIPNQQGCLVMVREGMRIDRQLGLRGLPGAGR